MNCPRHPETKMEKIRLDVYGCSDCGYSWLIRGYPKEKASEDAEISNWHCPECQDKIKRNYLDSYHCNACEIVWWIHAYRSEKYRARNVGEKAKTELG